MGLNNVVSQSPSQVRAMNLEIHVKSGKPAVDVKGQKNAMWNLKKVLWVMGATYIKERGCYAVPEHKAAEAQELIDRIGQKIEQSIAEGKAKREAKALAEAEEAAAEAQG